MNKGHQAIWGDFLGKQLLLVALSAVLLTHGVILYFTMPKTYDAFIHLFFADHYGRFWFEPWEYRWYTGFLTVSYPPMVHQAIALIGKVFPLKVAFCIYAIGIYEILVVGIYRFTKLFYDKKVAGVAALLAVVISSIIETLHVYGQMPTLTGLAFLLNALPFLYQYITKRKLIYLAVALSFLSVVICSHHVTAIFGMVFFIAPTIWMALSDQVGVKVNFFTYVFSVIKQAWQQYRQILLFGGLMIFLAITLIFPYWYWSKTDPITQVAIPHGSRDNFLINTSSGLIFFVIPLILVFSLLPAISFYITRQKRLLAWAVSFFLCLLLGSGGTTPLPKMLLGSNAFNILTLDRFGFWASIIAIPFMAKFIYELANGSVRDLWIKKVGKKYHFLLLGGSAFSYLLFIIFIFHLGSFRSLQPQEVDIKPIQNFLNRDEHMRWRFLTLGFGDQMAWLSANTLAASVDGDYHSARRLPELTTRPVERLENAKFSGEGGLASLTDFLTNSDKYSLKYIFSNDRYYDPLLYYTGWNRTIRLENGIMVWEKGNISTIRPIKAQYISPVLRYAWGIFPIASLIIAFAFAAYYLKNHKERLYTPIVGDTTVRIPIAAAFSASLLPLLFFTFFISRQLYELLLVKEQDSPETAVLNYYNKLDFQEFEKAFHFFKPDPTYTLDQYLLEKSVSDGGLLPNYAKLDSIHVAIIHQKADTASTRVFTQWRTAVGKYTKTDTLQLVQQDRRWYILPKVFQPAVTDEQVRSYTYVIFKKMGKRMISSFPAVKDDRVKKPFMECRQLNVLQQEEKIYLTGELFNADDIPVNTAVKVTVTLKTGQRMDYFPGMLMQYNLSPKSPTWFQVELPGLKAQQIANITVRVYTDVAERGYIHGADLSYQVTKRKENLAQIEFQCYNELANDVTVPGALIAEKDKEGRIRQLSLALHTAALRSGLSSKFSHQLALKSAKTKILSELPLELLINEQPRQIKHFQKDKVAASNQGIAILTHSFISQEIYLQ